LFDFTHLVPKSLVDLGATDLFHPFGRLGSVSSVIVRLSGISALIKAMFVGRLSLWTRTSKAQSDAVAAEYKTAVPLWFQRPPYNLAPSPSFDGNLALQIRYRTKPRLPDSVLNLP